MRYVAPAVSAIGISSAVEMSEDVDVVRARSIMTWEESSELRHAEGIGGLETAQKRVVDVGWVGGADAVGGGDNSGVDAGAVAVPDFDHGVGDGVAGCHVNELGVEYQFDTFLILDNLLADVFSADIWSLLVSDRLS